MLRQEPSAVNRKFDENDQDVRVALRCVPQIFDEHEPSGLAKTPFERTARRTAPGFR
jgi:hypothetical protein